MLTFKWQKIRTKNQGQKTKDILNCRHPNTRINDDRIINEIKEKLEAKINGIGKEPTKVLYKGGYRGMDVRYFINVII